MFSRARAYLAVFLVILALISLWTASLWGADITYVKPGPGDKCPVCGMFVAKYPDFIAVVTFSDGNRAFFDGVKDMMKCYLDLQKYFPAKKPADVIRIHVMDYYSLEPVDGFKAFYVIGSDVYGPMGKELIPFEKEDDAKEFMKDHKGKAILHYKDIGSETLKGLD